MSREDAQSLKSLVGAKTYQVWVDMLRTLVPDSRTHRLAPLIAGMLHYAVDQVEDVAKLDELEDEESAAWRLWQAVDAYDPEDAAHWIGGIVTQLFDDAGVAYERTSARGDDYSLVEAALYEYIHWFDMPWEA